MEETAQSIENDNYSIREEQLTYKEFLEADREKMSVVIREVVENTRFIFQ